MSTHEDALDASSSETQLKPTPETWVQWGVDVVRLWLAGWLAEGCEELQMALSKHTAAGTQGKGDQSSWGSTARNRRGGTR
ncbi:hypothetical protein EYF80_002380 [Liparis tanakae]|uniref:Uncharacterized protein n=1 Tax=Liparis tanakae TaxID=230148 RepID=A0A4Z2JC17_9TELE|nr:hypothetical protein EYF80_002380 [Liparis tanakae]